MLRNTVFALTGVVAVGVGIGGSAKAASLGYTLEISPNPSSSFNIPFFKLSNDSNVASITEFDITIGDTTRNFDAVFSESSFGALVSNLNAPDRIDDGLRPDNTNYTFTGFTPGEFFRFAVDLDQDNPPDGIGTFEDFRNVLFDLNGSDSSDNSLITVRFDDGSILSDNLPDFSATPDNIYTFSQSFQTSIPEPLSGYILELSGDLNSPRVTITNTSGLDEIAEFDLTIGDTNFNFDSAGVIFRSSGVSETLISPDFDFGGGVRSDTVSYLFTSFDPANLLQSQVDVDIDNFNSAEDYRQILFDLNGSDSSDNAQVTIKFTSGRTLSGLLPDFAENSDNFYSFSQSISSKPSKSVPEPASLLGLTAIGAITAGGVLKKKAA
jgi:hypothetical protein